MPDTHQLVNILLVDDRPENLLALRAVLTSPNYRLVEACSGEEALKAILSQEFAVIILDVQMPGLDGLETAMLIKKRESTREIPIIFVTAIHADEAYAKRGYEIGGVDYIAKPFDPNTLRSKVAVFVNLYERTRKLKADFEKRSQHQQDKLERVERETLVRFEILAETIPQLVWAMDSSGRTEYFNRRWYDFTGLEPARSHDSGWFQIIHPEDLERTIQAWEEARSLGRTLEVEHRLKRSDGQFRWHLTRATPMKDPQGEVLKWFGTSTDIEEQKRLESDLARSIRSRDRLLAVVSHDLKNPLNAIQLNASFAKRLPSDDPIHRIAKQLDQIHHSAERANHLIDDLLDVAQIESEHFLVDKKPSDICQIVSMTIDMLSPIAAEKGVTLESAQDPASCSIEGDTSRLQQLFSNLVGNAIKFTPRGGRIRVVTERKPTEVVFKVEDTGPGIEPENRARVFERNWQTERGKEHRGLGLGLFISKGIVEAHQGRIWVESGPESGATFLVTLPASGE